MLGAHSSNLWIYGTAVHSRNCKTLGGFKCCKIASQRFWVYYNKIPIYPIFYLLKGDYKPRKFLLSSLDSRSKFLAAYQRPQTQSVRGSGLRV